MGTEFNEHIAYYNGTADTNKQTTFASVNTYTPLLIIIDDYISTPTTITTEESLGKFKLGSSGVYLVQFRLSVTGGTNDVYKCGIALNGNVLSYTEQTFSTKGSNIWEVQNLALVNLDLVPISNSAFGSSDNTIQLYIQNTTDTSTFTLKNASFVIIRIQ